MGCASSTPVKEGRVKKNTTSAKSHSDIRKRDGSNLGPNLDVGPDYKLIKHLGTDLT